MKKLILIILALGLSACVEIGDTTNNTDSQNTTENNNSFNTYTEAEKELIADGYVPDEAGVCDVGYAWCGDVEKCLPKEADGSACAVHTDEEEAEIEELNGQ